MATTDPQPSHPAMGLHPLAGVHGAILGARHMCPECGITPNVFCRWCHGNGDLSGEELSQWQAAVLAEQGGAA